MRRVEANGDGDGMGMGMVSLGGWMGLGRCVKGSILGGREMLRS